MGRPAKSDSRDTRQAIIDVALDLFAENGFAGTSIRQIARAVNVAESALYYHFPEGKAAILEAVKNTIMEARQGTLAFVEARRNQLTKEDVGPMLHTLAERILTAWESPLEQRLSRLMLREGPQMLRKVMGFEDMMRGRAALTKLFSDLVERKLIAPFPAPVLALHFISPLVLMRLNCAMGPQTDMSPIRAILDDHINFFMKAVAP